jgi:hypothetical protein
VCVCVGGGVCVRVCGRHDPPEHCAFILSSYRYGEVGYGTPAAQGARRGVVSPRSLLGSVKCSQPDASVVCEVADLCRPLAPGALPHPTELRGGGCGGQVRVTVGRCGRRHWVRWPGGPAGQRQGSALLVRAHTQAPQHSMNNGTHALKRLVAGACASALYRRYAPCRRASVPLITCRCRRWCIHAGCPRCRQADRGPWQRCH